MYILFENLAEQPVADTLYWVLAQGFTRDEDVAIKWVGNNPNRSYKYCPETEVE